MFGLEKAHYDIDKIEFQCDKILSEKIKPPFKNTSFFYIIVGKPQSGKTTLLINMLTNKEIYKKVFDKILICMPSNSRKSLKNDIFEDLPLDQQFETISEDLYNKIVKNKEDFEQIKEEEKQKKLKSRTRHQLLILDDVTAYLKDQDNQTILTELSTNRRHLNLSIIVLVQFLRSIPRPIRLLATDVIFFKSSNNLDTNILREEYANLEKPVFDALTRFVFDKDHTFLWINKNDEIYYKNLQRIIFPSNSINDTT